MTLALKYFTYILFFNVFSKRRLVERAAEFFTVQVTSSSKRILANVYAFRKNVASITPLILLCLLLLISVYSKILPGRK